jgi:general secretion pathway protein B
MSFILDAIAKSEHDRQQQEVPGARTLALPIGSAQRPRRILSYLAIGALLLNAIVLVIWMQPDRSPFSWISLLNSDAIERSTQQVVLSDNTPAANQATSVEVTTMAASSKKSVETEITASNATAGNISSPTLPSQARKTVLPSESFAKSNGGTLVETRKTGADLEGKSELSPPRNLGETKGGEDTAGVRIEPDTLPGNIAPWERANKTLATQSVEEVIARRVSRLSELPADVRRDLPSVAFTGHLYSSNPRSSRVFVDDGRPLIAGQQIVDELILHEITPTGVVVEFRGYLIDIGVLQNWSLN